MLDLDEVAVEAAYLAGERVAIENEPSLIRAAELVERQLAGRGQRGRFKVRIERFIGRVPIWSATWSSSDWRSTGRETDAALEELAEYADRWMKIPAAKLGYHVVSPMPLADLPPLQRATHRQSRPSARQPQPRSAA
jgi:hypothetical protein